MPRLNESLNKITGARAVQVVVDPRHVRIAPLNPATMRPKYRLTFARSIPAERCDLSGLTKVSHSRRRRLDLITSHH
jgi:hypothetical protein